MPYWLLAIPALVYSLLIALLVLVAVFGDDKRSRRAFRLLKLLQANRASMAILDRLRR